MSPFQRSPPCGRHEKHSTHLQYSLLNAGDCCGRRPSFPKTSRQRLMCGDGYRLDYIPPRRGPEHEHPATPKRYAEEIKHRHLPAENYLQGYLRVARNGRRNTVYVVRSIWQDNIFQPCRSFDGCLWKLSRETSRRGRWLPKLDVVMSSSMKASYVVLKQGRARSLH